MKDAYEFAFTVFLVMLGYCLGLGLGIAVILFVINYLVEGIFAR